MSLKCCEFIISMLECSDSSRPSPCCPEKNVCDTVCFWCSEKTKILSVLGDSELGKVRLRIFSRIWRGADKRQVTHSAHTEVQLWHRFHYFSFPIALCFCDMFVDPLLNRISIYSCECIPIVYLLDRAQVQKLWDFTFALMRV